jgi:hypothetical protein
METWIHVVSIISGVVCASMGIWAFTKARTLGPLILAGKERITVNEIVRLWIAREKKSDPLRKTHPREESEPKPSRISSFARALLSEDSQEAFLSIHRDLALDAREMRENGESEVAIRNKIRRQTIIAYLAFVTAPIARALRAPFRWRRD